MRRAKVTGTILLWALGCSSSSGGGSGGTAANPCATPGATYLLTFTENPTGTCGAIPSELITISSSGQVITSTPLSCQSQMVSGCTEQNTNCTITSNGATCSATSDVTFAMNGASASGMETISCSGSGQSCTSTYTVSAARQ
jgi:hypothetical protein